LYVPSERQIKKLCFFLVLLNLTKLSLRTPLQVVLAGILSTIQWLKIVQNFPAEMEIRKIDSRNPFFTFLVAVSATVRRISGYLR
jgi:hypothetical protein